MAKFPWSHCKN